MFQMITPSLISYIDLYSGNFLSACIKISIEESMFKYICFFTNSINIFPFISRSYNKIKQVY